MTFALDSTLAGDHRFVADLSGSNSTSFAIAVTYQCTRAPPSFHPVTPARVYDSRWSPAPGGVTVPGFFAITPGNAESFSASAITWSTPGPIANGEGVHLDSSRQVKVWAGGSGGADFIVDITGYHV